MERGIGVPLALFFRCVGCSNGGDLEGVYSGASFLTLTGSPAPGTSATSGAGVSCSGSLQIEKQTSEDVRGTFDRRQCSGLSGPTSDVHGRFSGTVLGDGTATVTFSEAPLPTSAALTTSGGCPDDAMAMGPYVGRITRSSVSLQSQRFVLHCAGRPEPAPPAFMVEYQVEAAR